MDEHDIGCWTFSSLSKSSHFFQQIGVDTLFSVAVTLLSHSYSFLFCLSHNFCLSLARNLAPKYSSDGIKVQENKPENVTEWAANPGSPALFTSGVEVPFTAMRAQMWLRLSWAGCPGSCLVPEAVWILQLHSLLNLPSKYFSRCI